MKIIHESDVLAAGNLTVVYDDLKAALWRALRENQPMHEIEKVV